MRNGERREERTAAKIVEDLYGAETCFVGDAQGSHDYDLLLRNGRRGALEVTSCTNPERRQQNAEIAKVSGFETIRVETLRYRWDIWLKDATSSPRKVAKDGPKVLADLEKRGCLEEVDGNAFPDDCLFYNPDIARRLRECGIGDAIGCTDDPPGIFILPPGSGTGDSKFNVNTAIEAAAKRRDNRRKLSDPELAERHLFVWFDITEFDPWYAIYKKSLPSTDPQIPDEITHAWAAGIPFDGGDAAVWLWDGTQGWRSMHYHRTET